MLKEVGGTILCLVFLRFNISLKLPFFKLVLHLYARQTILIFGCLFPPPRERKSIYKNAKKMFINATVTIPQSGGGKKKKKVGGGKTKNSKCLQRESFDKCHYWIKHTVFLKKILFYS